LIQNGLLSPVCAEDPDEAVELSLFIQPRAALVDLDEPRALDLISQLHEVSPGTRVVALSEPGSDAPERAVEALASGAVAAVPKGSAGDLRIALDCASSDSPVISPEAAGKLLNSYMELRSVRHRYEMATIKALAGALEVRDFATGMHLHRSTHLAAACTEAIDDKLARDEGVTYGFMLHDVGKIGVPDGILNKPGPLDKRELEIMRRHPEMGVQITDPISLGESAKEVILSHHERWDGRGYPYGLHREDIPLTARIFSVADTFDAMTSDRPYRSALSRDDAVAYIRNQAGKAFDPGVADVFINLTAA
jgi:response regulator RpfG family c-di-GMP phosphodiesterase